MLRRLGAPGAIAVICPRRALSTAPLVLSSSASSSSARGCLVVAHEALVSDGALREDERQRAALSRLQDVRIELRAHWGAMRDYSEELISWHVKARAIRERQRAIEEERWRLASRPLWQRLWTMMTAPPSPTAAVPAADAPALETLIQTRAPQGALDSGGSCSGGSGGGCGGGGCSSGAATATVEVSGDHDSSSGGCSSGGGCGSGSGCGSGAGTATAIAADPSAEARAAATAVVAPPSDGPLSNDEKRHPFWTSGLGAAALKREAAAAGATATAVSKAPAPLALPPPPVPPPPPRGLFMYGDVG
eukprot:5645279-Prymnesium_polylepis.1